MSEENLNKSTAAAVVAAENDASSTGDGEADDLEESSVTMVDVLNHQHQIEEDAAAVLGGSDEKCCTYPEGYIKRQALYSCLTCCPESQDNLSKCAGICLACSLKCHEHHELIELYTKRQFRCDCPTERIPGQKCLLATNDEKLPLNANNLYSKNFQGLYCSCNRPYPDPDATKADDMMQCIICEDWHHMRHLENMPPRDDLYQEVICGSCMAKHEVLRSYAGLAVKNVCDDKLKSDLDKSISDILNMSHDSTGAEVAAASTSFEEEKDVEVENTTDNEVQEPEAKRAKLDADDNVGTCKRPKDDVDYDSGVIYLLHTWRDSLCRCEKCLKTYEESQLSFLLDKEDSLQVYEMKGLSKLSESEYETGIKALRSMGRTQQIDALTEYNHMKDKLMEYLHHFVATKKVVTEEDINRFFQQMKNEKNAHVGQPHFCR